MNLKLARTGMLLLPSISSLLLQTLHVTPVNFQSAKISAKSLIRCIQKGPTFSSHNYLLFRIYYVYV